MAWTMISFDRINEVLDKVAHGRSKGKTVLTFTER